MFYHHRGFTVRVSVKVAPMGRTALWSAPVRTLSTARRLTALASAKKVKASHTVNNSPCLTWSWWTGTNLGRQIFCLNSQTWLIVLLVSAGWRGPDCSTPCSEGTWGPGCNATCHCTNGAKCKAADGSCVCTAGWQGAHCDQPCPVSAWYKLDVFVNEAVKKWENWSIRESQSRQKKCEFLWHF